MGTIKLPWLSELWVLLATGAGRVSAVPLKAETDVEHVVCMFATSCLMFRAKVSSSKEGGGVAGEGTHTRPQSDPSVFYHPHDRDMTHHFDVTHA